MDETKRAWVLKQILIVLAAISICGYLNFRLNQLSKKANLIAMGPIFDNHYFDYNKCISSSDDILIEDEPSDDGAFFDPHGWLETVKFTTQKYGCYGDCDYNAIYNVMRLAEEKYWPEQVDIDGTRYRAPCGGSAMCHEPYLIPNVSCYIEVTDCIDMIHPNVLKTYLLDCRGDKTCSRGNNNCCLVTKIIKGKVPNLETDL